MNSFWFRMGLSIVAAVLQTSIKNPQSLEAEFVILTEIRDMINQFIPPTPPKQNVG